MPAFIKILTPTGLQDAPYTAESLADAVKFEPSDGVYTVTNTYDTFQVLKLDDHLDRLEDSARRENIPLNLNRLALRGALREMIAGARLNNVRFRVTVPRHQPDHLILTIEPFVPPLPEVYVEGIRCITLSEGVRLNPAAKTTGWMHDREQMALPEGIYTGLLLDTESRILEGVSSNFYAVLDGELRTAGEGVLFGIAQQIVFAIAPDVLPLHKEAIHKDEISRLSEAFITSSSRGIVPVVEIDGITIGDGKPGPYTRQLDEHYLAWVKEHLEDL
jgi:branched-chain amino acid aminotransferase